MSKRSLCIWMVITLQLMGLITCGKPNKAADSTASLAMPIEVAQVERGSIESKLDFLGNITASQEVKVYSTVPTRIVNMKVDVGDAVKKNQILAIVDNEKIKQAVIQAEAGLEAARAQFKNIEAEWTRTQKLYEANAISKSQFDALNAQREAARSSVKQAEAGLATMRNQMSDSYITAPISGVIASRLLEEGDQAAPAIPVFSIVKMNPVKIQIEIVENQIGLVKVGQKAHIKVESYPTVQFEGKIFKLNPTLNPITRTIGAEVLVENPEYKLKPGMFARVEIIIDKHEDVLVIPKYAILENTRLEYLGGEITNSRVVVEKFVFICQDTIALKRFIRTGIENGNRIEIIEGLDDNEEIVIVGQHNLDDSSRVEIITKRSAS